MLSSSSLTSLPPSLRIGLAEYGGTSCAEGWSGARALFRCPKLWLNPFSRLDSLVCAAVEAKKLTQFLPQRHIQQVYSHHSSCTDLQSSSACSLMPSAGTLESTSMLSQLPCGHKWDTQCLQGHLQQNDSTHLEARWEMLHEVRNAQSTHKHTQACLNCNISIPKKLLLVTKQPFALLHHRIKSKRTSVLFLIQIA